MTTVDIAPDALVILIGAAGSGKSTLAARLFTSAETLSSDAYRAAIAGDPADQSATEEAFARLQADLERRLVAGERTVVDATNVQGWARRRLVLVAARHRRPVVAIALAVPLEVSLARNARRADRRVPASVVRRQDRDLRRSLPQLAGEGYAAVVVVSDPTDLDALEIRA